MKRIWTQELVYQEALKYATKIEWKIKSPSSYNKAIKKGWIHEATSHMNKAKPHNFKWTSETVIVEAAKYSSRTEWKSKSAGSFLAAYRLKIIDMACKHMKTLKNTHSPEKEILQIVQQHYPSAKTRRFENKDPKYSFKRMELDVFIEELQKGIEFDSTYWHLPENIKKNRSHWDAKDLDNYHGTKDSFFAEQGIKVLHVDENTWKNDQDKAIKAILLYIGVLHASVR